MTMNAIAQFNAAVDRIRNIIVEAGRARNLPDDRYNHAMRVKMTAGDYNWKVDDDVFQSARNALGAWVASERQRGERERDEKLRALSIELHSLRATLPGLAAAAAVQLGAVANGMGEQQ